MSSPEDNDDLTLAAEDFLVEDDEEVEVELEPEPDLELEPEPEPELEPEVLDDEEPPPVAEATLAEHDEATVALLFMEAEPSKSHADESLSLSK